MWRRILIGLAIVVLGGAAAFYWATRPLPTLTIASWGGEYTTVQTAALFRPYTDKYRVNVHTALYNGGVEDIDAQVKMEAVDWDVVDFELPDAAAACRMGLLETIPPGTVADAEGLIPGALTPCYFGGLVYSSIVAFKQNAFPSPPQTLADFFDRAKFPGKRALKGSGPQDNLELALLADGVLPGDVYAQLATDAGVTRAFAKLDTIKKVIVWWSRAAEVPAMLQDGRAVMATALNGTIHDADKGAAQFGIVWDGQRYAFEALGIVKGTKHLREALDFIAFSATAEPQAEQAKHLPYGPSRPTALKLVGNAGTLPFLPTAHFDRALASDPDFWAEHGPALQTRWDSWIKE